MQAVRYYLLRVLIALDQLGNTLIGGWPDETLSASAYFGACQGKLLPRFFRPIIDWVAAKLGDQDHCHQAYLSEMGGTQLPNAYRTGKDITPQRATRDE